MLLAGSQACNGPMAAARDLVDPYQIVVGAGTGLGYRVKSLGLFDTGLAFGVKPHAGMLGWKYGRAFAFQPSSKGLYFDADQAIVFETRSLIDANMNTGGFDLGRRSYALLPAVFTWVDSASIDRMEWQVPEEGVELDGEHYLWSARTWRDERYAMIHAFDVEMEIMIVGYFSVGYSPGEALDFFTSLFGFDLAGDDDR